MPELTHKQARNRQKDIADELERLENKASESESRTLSPEDEQYWRELSEEFDELETHCKALERKADKERVEAITRGLGNPRARVSGDGATLDSDPLGEPDSIEEKRFKNPWDLSQIRAGTTTEERASELRARALSAVEKMQGATDGTREVMTRFVERHDTFDGRMSRMLLASSNATYLRAFGKLIGNEGNTNILDADEQRAVQEARDSYRAMSLTDAAGGYLVPFQLDPNVILTAAGSFNQVRQAARVVQATGDTWYGVASAGVTGSWDAEAAEVSDDAPTLSQPSVPVHKLAIFVPISIEALADAQNVAQEVGEMIAFEKDRMESVAFVTGSGSGQPTGIITALEGTSSEVAQSGAAGTFGLGDVYALDSALPARYRQRAAWLANRSIYNDVRQFDTSGGAALWERLGADVPPLLLGRPAYEAENMDGVIEATGGGTSDVLVFGDFSNYVVADRVGTTVEFIPHLFGANNRPTGQRGWYAYARVGADSVNDGAFRVLEVTSPV